MGQTKSTKKRKIIQQTKSNKRKNPHSLKKLRRAKKKINPASVLKRRTSAGKRGENFTTALQGKPIGQQIRELRIAQRYKQGMFASKVADLSVSRLSEIERGVGFPKYQMLVNILFELGHELQIIRIKGKAYPTDIDAIGRIDRSKPLGLQLKQIREHFRYNQFELARKVGKVRMRISEIEGGKGYPSYPLLCAILFEFGFELKLVKIQKG